ELAKFYSLLMVINATAPLIAPMAGGAILLLPFATWHTIFYSLSIIGVLIVIIITFRLKETLPIERRTPGSVKNSILTLGSLIKDRSFIGYALTVGFIHGGSFAYVAGTPFVYQDLYGVSPQTFSILFGINGLAIITGSFLVGRLGGIFHERRLLQAGVLTACTVTLFLLLMTIIKAHLALIVIPIFIYMITMGLILTSTFTLAMEHQSHRAGSASALLGTLPLVIGAIVAPLVGMNETTAIPMSSIMFSTTVLGGLAFFKLTKKEEK